MKDTCFSSRNKLVWIIEVALYSVVCNDLLGQNLQTCAVAVTTMYAHNDTNSPSQLSCSPKNNSELLYKTCLISNDKT